MMRDSRTRLWSALEGSDRQVVVLQNRRPDQTADTGSDDGHSLDFVCELKVFASL